MRTDIVYIIIFFFQELLGDQMCAKISLSLADLAPLYIVSSQWPYNMFETFGMKNIKLEILANIAK